MSGDSNTLDLIVHEEKTGSRLNLSLLSADKQEANFAGLLVVPEVPVPLLAQLQVSADYSFYDMNTEDVGTFSLVYPDGEADDLQYITRRYVTESVYQLVQVQATSETLGVEYQAFGLEDPFPLVLLPIAGGILIVRGIRRRHAKQDAAGIDMVQAAVQQGLEEGRAVHVVQEIESDVILPSGERGKAKSTIIAEIGERRAA